MINKFIIEYEILLIGEENLFRELEILTKIQSSELFQTKSS